MNNKILKDGQGVEFTTKTTEDVSGVNTSHVNVDTLPITQPLTDSQLRASAVSISFPDGAQVNGPLAQSILNTDLLTGNVNGWFDAASFQSGTVQIIASAGISAGTSRIGFIAGAGIWFDDSSTALAANASFTGTSRDLTVTTTATAFANAATYAKELRVSAESDQTGILWLEVSRDNTNWRRVKSIATTAVTGGGFYAEINHLPSWRYARVGFTNGATLQTRFTINSILLAS